MGLHRSGAACRAVTLAALLVAGLLGRAAKA